MIRSLCLLLLASIGCIRGVAGQSSEFTLLQLERQPHETLSFFVHHAPAGEPASPEQAAKFAPLPTDITAHLTDAVNLAGRRLIAVRYMSNKRLERGNTGAVGLVLLCGDPADHSKFAPLIVAGDGGGVIDDYSISAVRKFGEFQFIWMRRVYSGTARFVGRVAISAPDASSAFRVYPLFADDDPLIEIKKLGWEVWTRGNYFDEESLTWHYHLHRRPAKTVNEEENPHRYVRVRYEFRDGKLRPGKAEDVIGEP
jgi:hypothetical protein